MKSSLPLAAVTVILVILAGATGARGASVPLEEALVSHIGWEVDKTKVEEVKALEARGGKPTKQELEAEDVCTVASKDECRPARESGESGGFAFPYGVAIQTDPASPSYGDVYVTDTVNNRVQELTVSGKPVSMFGWGVNATKDREAMATRAEKNVCTKREVENSGVICKAGVAGTTAGQFDFPYSIAVDPTTGDIYVQEVASGDYRVDRYTADGRFVWMAGKGVNATKDHTPGAGEAEKNLCTAASGDVCKGGARGAPGRTEPATFNFIQGRGNLLAVGGPEHLLYVGDEYRVQEFDTDGTWVRELLLTSITAAPFSWVTGLALDETGNLYLLYPRSTGVVRKLNPSGKPIMEFPVAPSEPNAELGELGTLALDSSGHLVVSVEEVANHESSRWLGSLYDAGTGDPIARFTGWGRSGIMFNGDDGLYAAAFPNFISKTGSEVLVYKRVPAAGLVTSLVPCEAGVGNEALAAFECTVG